MTPRRWALLALALVGAGVALVWQADDPASSPTSAPDAGAGRPPPGVPPGWTRYEHARGLHVGSGFSMFLPAGYGAVDRLVGDAEGGRFRGPRHELSYEFDAYAPFREAATDEGETSLAREEAVVNGRHAIFQTVRTKEKKIFSSVFFALTPADAGRPLALAIFAVCDSVEECAEVWTIGRTVAIELSTASE